MIRGKGGGALALMIGATGIGVAPILVRLSEVGPVATGFYRVALAQPILWWMLARRSEAPTAPEEKRKALKSAALAGICFAADLSLWHWSLRLTSVANSTFLTNLTPFFVTLGAWILFREVVTRRLLIGMVIAFSGGFLLVIESLNLEKRFLSGDALAVAAAVFYAAYLLTVRNLRQTKSAWYVMAWTGVFTAPIFLAVSLASNEVMIPKTANGWSVVLALALVSHVGGQGLIAYGLAHISASVSSVMLLWQPIVAALLAWWILHEALTPLRVIGGIVIITGILLATRKH
jgi:drug/metabolite transporter (DMT)-like permease